MSIEQKLGDALKRCQELTTENFQLANLVSDLRSQLSRLEDTLSECHRTPAVQQAINEYYGVKTV